MLFECDLIEDVNVWKERWLAERIDWNMNGIKDGKSMNLIGEYMRHMVKNPRRLNAI